MAVRAIVFWRHISLNANGTNISNKKYFVRCLTKNQCYIEIRSRRFVTKEVDGYSLIIGWSRLKASSHTTGSVGGLKGQIEWAEAWPFSSLYSTFICSVSCLARSTSRLTAELLSSLAKELGELSEERLINMMTLQENPSTERVLNLFENAEHHFLHTDACGRHIRCWLTQKKVGNVSRPIEWWTNILIDWVHNLKATHRESVVLVGQSCFFVCTSQVRNVQLEPTITVSRTTST